jgi:hypothetical protein
MYAAQILPILRVSGELVEKLTCVYHCGPSASVELLKYDPGFGKDSWIRSDRFILGPPTHVREDASLPWLTGLWQTEDWAVGDHNS